MKPKYSILEAKHLNERKGSGEGEDNQERAVHAPHQSTRVIVKVYKEALIIETVLLHLKE